MQQFFWGYRGPYIGPSDTNPVSVSEGTDFGQKLNLNQRVYWFMV